MNYVFDGASLWGGLSALLRLMLGPITLLLVAYKLNPVEMGFYFQFFSLYAFQQVFEGGVGFLLLRYCSRLKVSNVEGVEENSELIEKINFSLFWYRAISIVLILILGLLGFYFFIGDQFQSAVNWEIPWIVYIVFSCLTLSIYPYSILNEVFHSRAEVYKKRAVVNLVQFSVISLSLLLDMKLFALSLSAVMVFILSRYFYYNSGVRILKGFSCISSRLSSVFRVYLIENWKLILVWVTGYFYWFSLPLLVFVMEGSKTSGAFSFTNSIVLAISTLASMMVITKAAFFSEKLRSGQFIQAVNVFLMSNLWSIIIYLPTFVLIFIIDLLDLSILNGKVLEGSVLFFLALNQLCVLVFSNLAFFCRLKDDDPFFWVSMCSNVLTPVVLLILSNSVDGFSVLVVASLILNLFYLIYGYLIYRGFVKNLIIGGHV
ncbi:MAG: hypothetical protein V7542_06805 [Limnobacter sp.]|uniref:hypothetical protein n=1 Tax=Limnobacter sp. TaxID=2003368 RepID=UPI0030020B05